VADLISSGPERPVHRRRPPTWLVTLVVAAALGGAVWQWGGVSSPRPRAEPTATSLRPTATPPPGRPATFRLSGRPGPAPPGLRLLVAGTYRQSGKATSPATVAADGTVTPLAGVRPAVQLPTEVRRLPAANAVVVQNQEYRPVDTFVQPDRGANVHLGAGLDTVVAAHGGGYLAADSGTEDRAGRLVSYTATGQVRWRRPLADPTWIQRDTPYGLLAEVLATSVDGQHDHGALALLDPRGGHLVHGIGAVDTVLASTDEKVAWIPYGCGEWPSHCTLAVTDLRTRQQQTVSLPNGQPPSYAAFSPNQTMLALSFAGRPEFADQIDPDGYVSVLSLVTEQFERMPGLTTAAKQAPTVSWAPDLQLVLGVNVDEQYDRVLLWSPGLPGPVVLPTRLAAYSAATYLAVLP
jgi:hypothetical protein